MGLFFCRGQIKLNSKLAVYRGTPPHTSIQVFNMSSIQSTNTLDKQFTLESAKEAIALLQAQLDKITAEGGAGLKKNTEKAAKAAAKAAKPPRANKGVPVAHGEYTKKVLAEHGAESAEFKAFIAKRVAAAEAGEMRYTADQGAVKSGKKNVGDLYSAKEALVGATVAFAAEWKRSHESEWLAFKAEFEAAHPKSSRASSVAGDESAGEGGAEQPAAQADKKKGRRKDSEMYSPEELVKIQAERKAKRAAKKAEKDAGESEERKSSVMAPAEPEVESKSEEEGDFEMVDEAAEGAVTGASLLPFTHKKLNYLRIGTKGEDGEEEWADEGDLWFATATGEKGDYAGILLANGKIDNSSETIANEPNFG